MSVTTVKNPATVYVELDVLLDTRLGTLARISDEIASAVLLSGNYHTRVSDDFPGVDKDVYQQQYKNRDVETLRKSVVTNAVPFLRHLVVVLTEQAIARPYHDGVKVVLNTFPYQLTGVEQEEILLCVKHWLNDHAHVELVFIHPTDLTPLHCTQQYSMMFVYEYAEWLNLHTPAFAHTPIPSVDMYAPELYSKVPTEEELAQVTREAMHPFRATEVYVSSLIGLKLIEIQHFCVLSPQNVPVSNHTDLSKQG